MRESRARDYVLCMVVSMPTMQALQDIPWTRPIPIFVFANPQAYHPPPLLPRVPIEPIVLALPV